MIHLFNRQTFLLVTDHCLTLAALHISELTAIAFCGPLRLQEEINYKKKKHNAESQNLSNHNEILLFHNHDCSRISEVASIRRASMMVQDVKLFSLQRALNIFTAPKRSHN